ncbi:GNAT family N-acetyltransferase [Shewanella psychrotolerans]|uniref:GNAT family N-acetyltransferase n=1 Tax=Shewanella psychrotolerans TaxID=2864206 RepID=UPI001C659EB6|nr:GNAT family N-acetyltransferase [Shewanella psychrotolerans]QYK00556.1 GNAT family N-acetyltransferase [Shewanella psychrotolerans]
MTIEFTHDNSNEFADAVKQKIAEFNWQHWEVSERLPLGLKLEDEQGTLLAGLSARTFGNWLMIDNLWVSDALRGQQIGSQILNEAEHIAKERGCIYAILDTLNFQAKPFYESRGYQLQWTLEAYPATGCKYFMTKALSSVQTNN